MAGRKNCGANTSLHRNRIIVMESWLSLGFINTYMYAQFSHTYRQKLQFLSFHIVYMGITVGMEYFQFFFPPSAVLKCCCCFFYVLNHRHYVLYFQCYLCYDFTHN